jgi:hypothetical protein
MSGVNVHQLARIITRLGEDDILLRPRNQRCAYKLSCLILEGDEGFAVDEDGAEVIEILAGLRDEMPECFA